MKPLGGPPTPFYPVQDVCELIVTLKGLSTHVKNFLEILGNGFDFNVLKKIFWEIFRLDLTVYTQYFV